MSLLFRLALLGTVLVAVACAPRGAITVDSAARGVGSLEPIFVGTSRSKTEDANVFGRDRASGLSYARLDVSVPPDREPGTLTFPKSLPANPRTDFVTLDAARYADDVAFKAAVNTALRALPPAERRIMVFVHGFNTNFAEGVYRQAQMMHDFGTPALGVSYSWPSAADARLYLYDRDSAFYARDGLEHMLRLLADTDADRIVIAAHSMGAQVTLEALRQMALTGAPRLFGKLTAVALLSPDVDVDLFRSEITPLLRQNIAWFIFVSGHDRALSVSSFVRGRTARLGSLTDATAIADLDVTVIDMTDIEGDPLGHSVVASSPVRISLVQGLTRDGPTILDEETANVGLAATTANVMQAATEVIVSPIEAVTGP